MVGFEARQGVDRRAGLEVQAGGDATPCRLHYKLLSRLPRQDGAQLLPRHLGRGGRGLRVAHPLAEKIDEIARGSFKHKHPPEIKGSGYVVRSLEAALWALHQGGDFREGCLLVVNLGDDADTTGAVYGQVAGAVYGVEGIPPQWRQQLSQAAMIGRFAVRLCEAVTVQQP